ncbi:hypothetical protein [Chengkuizengella axinellae]|uniref:DUF5067 domain-containing protein n=1 Tax=Chengkuizengella axinellae TaxID=3064388 RepID=A0ABT9IXM4_9BACL|nr:hypothetical protein [Chengkuizengella sp. 2205SS18-9]MDP5273872.1 hypothetical protein [Chengkuizengella sp. 2205SS18-9]
MKKRMKFFLFSCFILIILSSCNNEEAVIEMPEEVKTEIVPTLAISPAEFMKGDAQILATHFDDWQTGKVNIEYTGEENKMIVLSYDIYKSGELVSSNGSMGSVMFGDYNGKLLISLMDEDTSDIQDYSLGLSLVENSGSASSAYSDDMPELQRPDMAASTIWSIHEKMNLNEKEEAVVWAYLVNENSIINPDILTEENLKKDYDFAFVVKIALMDEADYGKEIK